MGENGPFRGENDPFLREHVAQPLREEKEVDFVVGLGPVGRNHAIFEPGNFGNLQISLVN